MTLPLPAVRRLARKRRSAGDEDPLPLSLSYKVHVASVNNFPTAAGLASSAAGYACLGGCPQGDPAPQCCAAAPGVLCSGSPQGACCTRPRPWSLTGLKVQVFWGLHV